jgi:hypothetical protein
MILFELNVWPLPDYDFYYTQKTTWVAGDPYFLKKGNNQMVWVFSDPRRPNRDIHRSSSLKSMGPERPTSS